MRLDINQGGVAQLGERRLCKPEVVGSIPSASTSLQVVRAVDADRRSANPAIRTARQVLSDFRILFEDVFEARCAVACKEVSRRLLFLIVNMMLSELHSSACYPAWSLDRVHAGMKCSSYTVNY